MLLGWRCRRRLAPLDARGCIDFSYTSLSNSALDPAKVRDVPRWLDSEVYDDRERAVLDCAQVASATPAAATDERMPQLHEHFNDAEITGLGSMPAWACAARVSRTAAGPVRHPL